MLKIRGCGTALVTPFCQDSEVDYNALRKLVRRQLDSKIHFLVPLGTTGETPCLEDEEKIKILAITKEEAEGKVPVVAGAGSNCTRQVVRNIKLLGRYDPDAFLVVVPYYNKPTQKGIFEHFKAIAGSTDKQIILYNVPGRTGVNMTAETTLKLSEIDNISAVKEASGNMEQVGEILRHAPEGFGVFSGNDDDTYTIMSNGGCGVISVASNIAPGFITDLVNMLSDKENGRAKELNERLMPLYKNCFIESNPIPVKAGLYIMGLIENVMRLPLTSALPSTIEIMKKTITDLKIL